MWEYDLEEKGDVMIKRIAMLVISSLLVFTTATADHVIIDANEIQKNLPLNTAFTDGKLSGTAQSLCVSYDLGDSTQTLSLLVCNEEGEILFAKEYESISGLFVSDIVMLKNKGGVAETYMITLTVGESLITFPYKQLRMYLEDNAVCLCGINLSEKGIRSESPWLMATVVDVEAAEGKALNVPLIASSLYVVGDAAIAIQNGMLQVTTSIDQTIDAIVTKQRIYVVDNASQLNERNRGKLSSYKTGQPIDVLGKRYVMVYLDMRMSYNPNTLERYTYQVDDAQEALYQEMEKKDTLEPVG